MNSYNTLTHTSEALYKEKGSKFIGFAFPLLAEKDTDTYLNEIKEKHPKATHHCYAYKYGLEDPVSRANDDGEPSSSAGKPILGQIESHELHNVLIIVVRYYGGTKLGVGGLQTAYKAAARWAIEENDIVEKEIPAYFTIIFPFDLQGVVDHLVKSLKGNILEKKFEMNCQYNLQIPKAMTDVFFEKIKAERRIELSIEN